MNLREALYALWFGGEDDSEKAIELIGSRIESLESDMQRLKRSHLAIWPEGDSEGFDASQLQCKWCGSTFLRTTLPDDHVCQGTIAHGQSWKHPDRSPTAPGPSAASGGRCLHCGGSGNLGSIPPTQTLAGEIGSCPACHGTGAAAEPICEECGSAGGDPVFGTKCPKCGREWQDPRKTAAEAKGQQRLPPAQPYVRGKRLLDDMHPELYAEPQPPAEKGDPWSDADDCLDEIADLLIAGDDDMRFEGSRVVDVVRGVLAERDQLRAALGRAEAAAKRPNPTELQARAVLRGERDAAFADRQRAEKALEEMTRELAGVKRKLELAEGKAWALQKTNNEIWSEASRARELEFELRATEFSRKDAVRVCDIERQRADAAEARVRELENELLGNCDAMNCACPRHGPTRFEVAEAKLKAAEAERDAMAGVEALARRVASDMSGRVSPMSVRELRDALAEHDAGRTGK